MSAYQVLKLGKKDKATGKLVGGGLLKRQKIIYGALETMRMTAIYAAALRKKGIDPKSIPVGEFQTRVRRALGGRLKSVGFVASAFVPVLRKLGAKLGISPYRPAQANASGKPKGNATPAVDGWNCKGTFEVSAGLNVESPESRARVRGVLENAIAAGFNAKSSEMEHYAAKELNKVWQS